MADRLSDSDRRLARLGAAIVAADPARARALLRVVETAAGAIRLSPGRVRRCMLHPARVQGDFARGDVVTADGWVIARSEAALCVYLEALVRAHNRPV
jgi:hypothetical protein